MNLPKVQQPVKWPTQQIGRKEATFPRPILSFLGFVEKYKRECAKNHYEIDSADIYDLKLEYDKYRQDIINS